MDSWSFQASNVWLKKCHYFYLKLRENTPLNQTQALTKRLNMDIWLFGKLNQLFIKGSYTGTNFLKIE